MIRCGSYPYFILKLVFVLVLVNPVLAQRAWLPGYIIFHHNDSIQGLIEVQVSEKTPVLVSFKSDDNAEKQIFKPSQIIGFSVNGSQFWSVFAQMEKTPFYAKRTSDTSGLELYTDSVFAEQLVYGERQLFKIFNTDGKLHFYIGSPDALILLEYKLYEANIDTKPYLTENRKFCGQLNYYLSDCQGIYDRLLTLKYTQEDLLSLFKYYKTCTRQQLNELRKEPKSEFSLGVMVGLNRTSLNFKASESYAYIGEANFNKSYDVCGGIKARWLLKKHLSRYYFDAEALYTRYRVEGNYVQVVNSTLQFEYKSTYGAKHLQFNLIAGINSPKQFGSIFCHLGVLSAVQLSETNYLEIEKTYFSNKTQITNTLIENSQKMEVGLLLGTGLTINHFTAEGRLQRSNGPSDIIGLGVPRFNMMLLLGYQF